jgi:hypothetical protein
VDEDECVGEALEAAASGVESWLDGRLAGTVTPPPADDCCCCAAPVSPLAARRAIRSMETMMSSTVSRLMRVGWRDGGEGDTYTDDGRVPVDQDSEVE